MDLGKPPAQTSMNILAKANRQLLAAMAREKRARIAYQLASADLAKAKRCVTTLVSAISQP